MKYTQFAYVEDWCLFFLFLETHLPYCVISRNNHLNFWQGKKILNLVLPQKSYFENSWQRLL